MLSAILTVLLLLVVGALAFFFGRLIWLDGHRKGYSQGKDGVEAYWEKLRKTPIAGQTVEVPAFGEVVILGRGDVDGVPHIDYISTSVLKGRSVPELEEEELNANTISCPLDEFIVQAEVSLKYLGI